MITENIKNFSDEEIINLINKIVMGEVEAELSDLKAILAEASGRKLEKSYINIIAERIREKIQPEKVEQKRKSEQVKEKPVKKEENAKKVTFDDVYSDGSESYADYDEDYEDENYPVLSFLASLYKIFAWILFAGLIVAGIIASLTVFKQKIIIVCALMLGDIIISIITLLLFLGMSEKIRLKLDIERHLRTLAERK